MCYGFTCFSSLVWRWIAAFVRRCPPVGSSARFTPVGFTALIILALTLLLSPKEMTRATVTGRDKSVDFGLKKDRIRGLMNLLEVEAAERNTKNRLGSPV